MYKLADPDRPVTDPVNLSRFHDSLSYCRAMASTLWALAEAMWKAEVHAYAHRNGGDAPYREAVKHADRNDDVIRLQHFAAELEELACNLDTLTDLLLPVAYPPKTAPAST